MTEIIAIFSQFLIFLVMFSFPFGSRQLNNFFGLNQKTLNIIDAHAINIIFFSYISLLISFLNFDLKVFFKIYFFLSIFSIIYNLNKFKTELKSLNFLLSFIFFLIIISIFFNLGQNLKLEADGHHWLERVLVFFNGNDIENIKYVSTYPQYPHLGSYIWAFFWKNSFLELEYLGRCFYLYFYVISIFLIFNYLNTKNNIVKIFLILFFIFITYEPYLFAGYQEYLIFSTLVIASRFISLINFKDINNKKIIYLIISILYLNCWFKDEGIIYFIIFSFSLIIFLNTSYKNKFFLFFQLLILLVLQFFLQKYLIGIYGFPHNSLLQILPSLFDITVLLTKISKIFLHSLIAFIKHPAWILIFISLITHIFFIKKIDIKFKFFIFCLILNLGFIVVLFFSFGDLDFMLRITLDRLLFQISGFYLVLILMTINNLKIFKSNKKII